MNKMTPPLTDGQDETCRGQPWAPHHRQRTPRVKNASHQLTKIQQKQIIQSKEHYGSDLLKRKTKFYQKMNWLLKMASL